MGQAKQRGTFEQRKAEAIAAGRIKQRYSRADMRNDIASIFNQAFLNRLFKIKNR